MIKPLEKPGESARTWSTVARRFSEQICWAISLLVIASTFPDRTTAQTREAVPGERSRYQIQLKIDVDALSYSGSERVLWINRGDHATSTLYFHLYSNLRVEGQAASVADEPRLEVTKVRHTATDAPLPFVLEEQGTTLRVNLRESVPVNGAVEVALDFRGNVPEVDPEESAITTHVIKQVSAALRDEREMRRARDLNFRCRGVMLLGSAYPVLAVHDGDDWRRRLEPGIGDIIFNESADYEVTVSSAPGVNVFASGTEEATEGQDLKTFSGFALRDFAIVAGRGLRSEQTTVGQTTLRSVFLAEHERVGKHVLSSSAAALRVFSARFGSLPYKTITVAEAPLIAGLGSTEFSGLLVIASAFYVDFDSPAMRNLPEIIREQRPAVEQSLEWTVAHLLAHQWWGTAVGNDPAREPVLDEALACWSALLYYEAVHGKEQAAIVQEDQLLGVYRLYRTFGGEDMDANRASRDYRNSFQYAAIVATKGAMMFVVLRNLLGDEKFFAALSSYYKANQFEIARLEDLQGAFIAESPLEQRRTVARTFNRWLESKRGDEDIAKPDQELAASLGIPSKPNQQKKSDRTALSAFAKLGKFFWQQMTRIR